MNVSILIPVLIAAIAPLGAYLIARRLRSGNIESSEAVQLWEESQAMRNELRLLLTRADSRIERLEARVAVLEELNAELRKQLRTGEAKP